MESENKNTDFSKMSVIEIKKYLIERGVTVNGYHEASLIEIANSVQKMKLPSFESLLCKNTNEQQRDGKLLINDMEVENWSLRKESCLLIKTEKDVTHFYNVLILM